MSVKFEKYFGKIAAVWCLFLFFGFAIAETVSATIKPPVHVELMTGWKAEKGGPHIQIAEKGDVIKVITVILPRIDVDTANFELIMPQGWEFVSGRRTWSGKLSKDEKRTLKATLRVISDTFGILRGKLILPEFGTSIEGMLDLRNPETTDRISEWGETRPGPSDTPKRMAEDVVTESGIKPEQHQILPEIFKDCITPDD